jgi:hypothetical protein
MPNNQLQRTHTTIDYEAGESVTVDLPRSHFYERLNLLMSWDVTVNTADTPQNGAGILDLIEDISVKFNGSKTPKSTGLATSHYIDWFQYGTRPVYDSVDLSTASQQTGQVQTFVDFLIAPGKYGAMLPSFEFSDLTLTIKWATGSAIADDVTVNDASVAVGSRERKKKSVPSANRPMSAILDALSGFKETERRKSIDVSGKTTVDLPKGNTYYAIPMLVFDGDSPSNTLVENLTIEEDGVSVHKDTTFDLARANDKQEYGIEDRPAGFVYLNYGQGGDLDDVVPTRDMDAFELTLDTDGTAPTDPAEVRYVTQTIVR